MRDVVGVGLFELQNRMKEFVKRTTFKRFSFSRQVIETISSTNYTYCAIITHCLLVLDLVVPERC